jgi:thiamine biosynthesis lipoprotein
MKNNKTNNNNYIRTVFLTGLLFCLILLSSCTKKSVEPQSKSLLLLGTVCKVTIYDKPSEQAFAAAFERIGDIEARMSLHKVTSELEAINKKAGEGLVSVSDDTYAVVEEALEISRLSNGAFDPTVGPLVEAWDIGGENPRKPTQEEIDSLLPLIGYERVLMDSSTHSIGLEDAGMILDLGGIAKGYAADEVAEVLSTFKVKSAIVNLGGNVLTMGSKPDGSLWKIGIQDPDQDRGGYVMILSLKDQSLVTSGPYERFFEQDGKVYHHILDTDTGYPVESEFTSVSIITPKSFLADALSTSLYALGYEKGMAMIDSMPEVEAVFFTSDRKILLSKGLKEGKIPYTITNEEYTLSE